MVTNDDAAMGWAHGFICGMEYLALAYEARVDAGQEPAGAILGGQAECLVFVEGLIANFQGRGAVVDLLRRGGACDD
jgi:hypothetical protein